MNHRLACCLPFFNSKNNASTSRDVEEIIDQFLWSRDLGNHSCGEYSFAVVQANQELEDYSQVDTSRDAIFAGVYDGQTGPEAARFVAANLFNQLISRILHTGKIAEDEIKQAFSATDDKFLNTVVQTSFETNPLIAATGSCCLMGLIWGGNLLVANAGDSRAVLGSVLDNGSDNIVSEQLTVDHNVTKDDHREELIASHPDDPNIVFQDQHNRWRLKGLIQVSRSIGYAYMKRPEFHLSEDFPEHHLPEPVDRPVLTAVPSVLTRILTPNDRFLILASDGLWDNVTNQEAAEMVHNNRNTRSGVAKKLLEMGLLASIAKSEIEYDMLKLMGSNGVRSIVHDDITVIVIYIDHAEQQEGREQVSETSLSGYFNVESESEFSRVFDHCA